MARLLSIEIGNARVRVAEIDDKKGKIYHCFQFLAPQGAVDDGFIRDTKGLGDILAGELAARKIRTRKAGFVVTSGRIASREIFLPMVKKNKIQSIIEANAADYFPIDPSKYILSYNLMGTDQQAAAEKQYRLMVFASPKSISAACRETAEAAGLTLVCLDYTGNSIYAAVREAFAQGTHMLMKIEEKSTMITIIRDGVLALQRNVNYGVDLAVEALRLEPVFGTGLDYDSAEAVLCTRRCINPYLDMDDEMSQDGDGFVQNARRNVTESLRYLVGNISRIMDYYISRNQDAEFSALFCCGLGAEVEGLRELLSNELAQRVETLDSMDMIQLPKDGEGTPAYYAAVTGITKSGVNLMEKTAKKKKENKDSIHGAVIVFAVGLVSSVVLCGAGMAVRMYQEKEQARLQKRIEEEKSIEEIYQAYNHAKTEYANYQAMYSYTDTPNEQLGEFLVELEEKMPSNMTVDTFQSTGTQVSFTMCVTSKAEAANTLMQLRTFESLRGVTTTGIDEAEDGTVNMSVICTYRDPAAADVESGQ